MKKIAVLGDGGWGTTLSLLLCGKGYDVSLWSAFDDYAKILDKKRINPKFLPDIKIPKQIKITSDLKEAIDKASFVVLAIPSKYMRQVLENLKGLDLSDKILVSVAKGIENKTLLRMSQLVKQLLGGVKIAVLSGPTIAPEIAKGLPSACVAASDDEVIAKQVQEVFSTDNFRVYTSRDVAGVELGGAVKNVIAIAAGICDGLKLGTNSKAGLMTRGMVEMARLGEAMGAESKTFWGLSGIGDLITTCVSLQGRNHWAGLEIARGKKVEEIEKETPMVAEGLRTCVAIRELAKKYNVDMPITNEVYSVLYEGKDPRKAVYDLMTRERKSEA